LTVERADIQPKNILLGVLDTSAFTRYEEDEHKYPMPRKELPSRTVYTSKPMLFTKGAPSLADLSEARFENPENVDFVMPDLYRAPEVVLGMPWSYPIDTWGFAMTVCSATRVRCPVLSTAPNELTKPAHIYGISLSRNGYSDHMVKMDATQKVSTWRK